MASTATLLLHQAGVQEGWTTAGDAVAWFTQTGWQVDRAGEALFREDHHIPGGLLPVSPGSAPLPAGHLDGVNTAVLALLAQTGPDALGLPFAGEAIKDVVVKASGKEPVAVLVLDACRFDLGCRLAEGLNQGEPARRADVRRPVPPSPRSRAGDAVLSPRPRQQTPRRADGGAEALLAGHRRGCHG